MSDSSKASLVTGGSGFLGSLVAAALLGDEGRRLLLPIRPNTAPADCLSVIRSAVVDRGVSERDADDLIGLVTTVELPSLDRLSDLDKVVCSMGIDEVVHCAGCVDYFDKRLLQVANVDFTSNLLEAARRWDARRFLYLSSAYCAGYRSDIIPECLHPDPAPKDEPTDYTRSKRMAEWLIAESGIPFVIIRPSIVIGDSRTGIYTGKNYGLYQMWRAIEGLLCREYYPIWYTVAPPAPVNFIHQDSFQHGFIGIYRSAEPGAIVHLVADHAESPTMRELCELWAEVYCPAEIHCYAEVDDVPLQSIPTRQRRFLEIAAKNLEIATHPWKFERTYLDGLQASGLSFAEATLETIARCQRRYIEGSERIREHMRQYSGRPGERPRLIDMFAITTMPSVC